MHIRSKTVFILVLLALTAAANAVAQDTINVTGKWAFTVETGAGTGSPMMEFKQEGDKLTGHYSGQLGEADLKGTVKGKDIEFTFTSEVSGYQIAASYKGTLESADSMKGTLSLAGLGDGTFTAKKQK